MREFVATAPDRIPESDAPFGVRDLIGAARRRAWLIGARWAAAAALALVLLADKEPEFRADARIIVSGEGEGVVTATGGVHGGGARLTPRGRQLIDDYRAVERAAEKIAARQFRGTATRASGGRTAKGSLRRPLARSLRA